MAKNQRLRRKTWRTETMRKGTEYVRHYDEFLDTLQPIKASRAFL